VIAAGPLGDVDDIPQQHGGVVTVGHGLHASFFLRRPRTGAGGRHAARSSLVNPSSVLRVCSSVAMVSAIDSPNSGSIWSCHWHTHGNTSASPASNGVSR